MWATDQVHIGRMQARLMQKRAAIDANALRLRLGHLLNSAELQPPQMPPSAILVVRRLADPLPRRLTPWQDVLRVDAAWERSIQHELATWYRQATRPLRGEIPVDAAAVRFADEGEMLACLALDMSRGTARDHWCWRVMLRTLPTASAQSLTTLLCREARYVPAALQYLAAWGQAVTVVDTLTSDASLIILAALGQTYGLADLPRTHAWEAEQRTSAVSLHQAPWAPWLPAALAVQRLGKEQVCLLGVGLGLSHAPSVVRSETFQQALQNWWRGHDVSHVSARERPRYTETSPASHDPAPHVTSRPDDSPSMGADRLSHAPKASAPPSSLVEQKSSGLDAIPPLLQSSDSVTEGMDVGERTSSQKHGTSPRDRQTDRVERMGILHADDASHEAAETVTASHAASTQGAEGDRHGFQQDATGVMVSQATAPLFADGVDTRLGGVLYLINLMRYLALPACFEAAWELASQVGAWGVLEMLGRALLCQQPAHFAADPLWHALADLDGREPGTLPGGTWGGHEDFYLPKEWVVASRNGENRVWHWATAQQRLRLWSSQGYLLMDCHRDTSVPFEQARAALNAYSRDAAAAALSEQPFAQAPLATVASPLLRGLNPHLIRWLAMVLPSIRLRLQQALTSTAEGERDLGRTLLLCRGKLYVTRTHVDLVMGLDDISLTVRLAGLDANPGWLPDFARVVQFHFV